VRILDAGDQRPIIVDSNVVTIGRSHLADIHAAHASVSKLHCRLTLTPEGIELLDLGSRNGTWLDQRRVFHVAVSVGDVVIAGQCRIEILSADAVDVDAVESPYCGGMFGASLVMRELFARLHRLAEGDVPVVFLGEIGAGKEVAARTLHSLSHRAEAPFVVLDAAMLPRSGLDEVGFDQGRGVGANRADPTVLEHARGGTLLIDNIDEFPLLTQNLLLRLIQAAPSERINVRIMASSRRDLRQVVVEDRLREDLYYQIAPAVVEVPALRKRSEDIVPLALELLAEANSAHGRRLSLSPEAVAVLTTHAWPANIRELRGVIGRAVFEAEGPEISASDIVIGAPRSLPVEVLLSANYAQAHRTLDQHFLPLVVENTGYNISKVGERLGISRQRVRALLQEHGLYPFNNSGND